MEIKKVLAHTCFKSETPLRPGKCRCRQYVSESQAAAEVAMGAAQYVVIAVKIEKSTTLCLICNQIPQFQKGCLGCGGKGVLDIKKRFPVYGHDIIRNVNEEGQRNTTTKVKKSPTIEKAHMERAYVDGRQDEQLRIEEYGAITRDFIKSLISGYEPADDQKTGTGRRYDYGRSI